MSRSEAFDYCKNLREHGHSDWKLPKTEELTAKGFTEGYWASDSTVPASLRVICVRNMPEETGSEAEIVVEEVCLHARKTQNEQAWKLYLEMYPEGACANEARDALDKTACKKAYEINTIAAWKEYLTDFPDGKYAFEFKEKIAQEEKIQEELTLKEQQRNAKKDLAASAQTKTGCKTKIIRTEGKSWCDGAGTRKRWVEAYEYCRSINKNGKTGWRLPNIEELQLLNQEISLKGTSYWCAGKLNGYWNKDIDNNTANETNPENTKPFYCVRNNR